MTTAAKTAPPALRRRLGLGLLIVYGVGVMIGAGVYVLIGEVAGRAGAAAPLAFLLAGVCAAFSAASFGELSARLPESAGEAAYARAAFSSESLGVIVGLAVMFLGLLSGAAVLRGGSGYLSEILGGPDWLLILGLGAALTLIACAEVSKALWVAAALTCIEAAGLLAVAAAGFAAEPAGPSASDAATALAAPGGLAGLGAAVFLAFFAFIGFEDMVNMAEETVDPARNLPRAILIALVIVAALYVIIAAAAIRVVPPNELAASDAPLALVWTRASGFSAAPFAAIAVAAAANGVLAQIVMAARVGFGLGRRTRWLAFLHQAAARGGAPTRATLLAGAIALGLALAAPIDALASAATVAVLIIFAVVNISLIALKRRGPAPDGAFSTPMVVPALGASLCLALLPMALL